MISQKNGEDNRHLNREVLGSLEGLLIEPAREEVIFPNFKHKEDSLAVHESKLVMALNDQAKIASHRLHIN